MFPPIILANITLLLFLFFSFFDNIILEQSFPIDEIAIKTYHYSSFFSSDDLIGIKKDIWENMSFQREYGQERGGLHYKSRLYTLQSHSKLGFGYNNVWIDAVEFSQSTQSILDLLQKRFPDQCCSLNSALITVYDCSNREVDQKVSTRIINIYIYTIYLFLSTRSSSYTLYLISTCYDFYIS